MDFFFDWVLPMLFLAILVTPIILMIVSWVREGDAIGMALDLRGVAHELAHHAVTMLEERDSSLSPGGMDMAVELRNRFTHPDRQLTRLRKRVKARWFDDVNKHRLERHDAEERELLDRIDNIPQTRAERAKLA